MASHPSTAAKGALRLVALVTLLFLASPAVARSADRWNAHIAEASVRFGIPEEWIRRVIRAESGGRTMMGGRPITSRAGAMGLMQLMPGTWAEMRTAYRLGPDPHDPRDNILAGTAYLRAMHDRFGYPGIFAAYNAGPARYADHLATGRRLPTETIAYVAQVGETSPKRWAAPRLEPRRGGVFVALLNGPPPSRPEDDAPLAATNQLFARLSMRAATSE